MKYLVLSILLSAGSALALDTATSQDEQQTSTKIATMIIVNCLNQVEWVGMATPDKWTIIHTSKLDPKKVAKFVQDTNPTVFKEPGSVCI